ncbi:enoyl-CoA hydratase/isomerase family protein [Burkholderia vietnamiensis]|uniref:enoyl-CoA hydratase/isomerase family protein n=1 Tax=Burkholderia vietnamiensis TaxID=60552 RepID=UPI00075697C2|nr:enoyl-CoA hydratase/isomerase family protein [Burkholderia vietnamiensis]KVF24198.1 enoyl-CoA hydratase [Burkholderia vietnamiensis]KVF66398.1 enoyl-CoA hydratase [Burkholderia vietnamiensis]
MSDQPLIRIEKAGPVAIVSLNRPVKLNALMPSMLDQLEFAAGELESDASLRAVVLTGAGERAFCVGADINEWAALAPLDMWRVWVARGHRIFDRWATLRLPVVAAINGPAFGGGLELATVADVRVADPAAMFALPEAGIATCPGWSGTQRLVSLIGPSHVKSLALTASRINAQRAYAIGLVDEISEPKAAVAAAVAIAEKIATLAPVSVQLTKQLINAAAGQNTGATLEAMAGALSATTLDAKEGLASFRERRTAQYEGH